MGYPSQLIPSGYEFVTGFVPRRLIPYCTDVQRLPWKRNKSRIMSSQELSSSSLSVSSQGDASQEGEEVELGGEEEGVAVAQPPRSSSTRAEMTLNVAGALEMLDQVRGSGGVLVCSGRGSHLPWYSQLVSSNQLGKERAARLRRKYKLLRDSLER